MVGSLSRDPYKNTQGTPDIPHFYRKIFLASWKGKYILLLHYWRWQITEGDNGSCEEKLVKPIPYVSVHVYVEDYIYLAVGFDPSFSNFDVNYFLTATSDTFFLDLIQTFLRPC